MLCQNLHSPAQARWCSCACATIMSSIKQNFIIPVIIEENVRQNLRCYHQVTSTVLSWPSETYSSKFIVWLWKCYRSWAQVIRRQLACVSTHSLSVRCHSLISQQQFAPATMRNCYPCRRVHPKRSSLLSSIFAWKERIELDDLSNGLSIKRHDENESLNLIRIKKTSVIAFLEQFCVR